MLGWFKKKFKKEEEVTAQEVEQLPEESPSLPSEADKETEAISPAPAEDETRVPSQEADTDERDGQPEEKANDQTPSRQAASQPEPASSGIGSMFQRLSTRLSKTKESLVYRMDTLFLGKKEIDADRLEEIEAELHKRAMDKDVYGSTTALIFEAKALNPAKYREKQSVPLIAGDITIKLAIPDYDDKLRLPQGDIIEGEAKEIT